MFSKIKNKIKNKIVYKLYGRYPEFVPFKILGDEKFVGLDIGAAAGIPWHWSEILKFGFIYGFEPHEGSAKQLEGKYNDKHYAVIRDALSKEGGYKNIYLTNAPTGSSLLEPNLKYEYVDPSYFVPWTEQTILTKTAESVFIEYGIQDIDAVKIDTQGTELDILIGLGSKYIEKALCVEFEAGVPGAYKGQTEFFETHQFMSNNNFELFDLKPARLNVYFKNGLPYKNSHTATSKIHEVDVLYFKKLDYILDSGNKSKFKKLLVAYCVYSFFDEAYLAVDKAAKVGLITAKEQSEFKKAIIEWHDYKSHFKYHWFNYGV